MNVLAFIEEQDFIETMAGRAVDLSKPLFEKVAPIHWKLAASEFDQEGHYTESGFVPWAPFKRQPRGTSRGAGGRFTSRKLLNKTGRMRRAVTTFSPPSTVEVTADTLTFRSHIPYEKYHQDGVPARNLPARPFARFEQKAAQEQAVRELMAWVVEPVDPAAAQRVRNGG
jgi:phage gpG-like protein